MKLTAITCTWNRPEAFKLCQKYVSRQTRQPDQWLVLDGPGKMGDKVLAAIEAGKIEGDAILWTEDDDYIFPGWFAWCEKYLDKGYEVVGQGNAFYYNVTRRWWSNCHNTRHASLCQTAITADWLEVVTNVIRSFDNQFFDTRLWRLERNRYLHLPTEAEMLVIGIKAMPGCPGYSGEHRQVNPDGVTKDDTLDKLRELIGNDADAYAPFYDGEEELLRLAGAWDNP